MSKKLRLYVWEGVLADYTDGIAFALATSVDQARDLIMYAEDSANGKSYKDAPYKGGLWKEIAGDPTKIYDSPVGFAIEGCFGCE